MFKLMYLVTILEAHRMLFMMACICLHLILGTMQVHGRYFSAVILSHIQ